MKKKEKKKDVNIKQKKRYKKNFKELGIFKMMND